MSQYPNRAATDMQRVQMVVEQLFPACSPQIERVAVGVSTYVYRILAQDTTWYLRVLPEEGASFAPEAEVHTRLRQMQVRVPEIIFVEPYNGLLQRSIMLTTEIPGQSLAQSQHLGEKALTEIFTSLLTSVRVLARSLQKRPPNSFTRHLVRMLRANLARL